MRPVVSNLLVSQHCNEDERSIILFRNIVIKLVAFKKAISMASGIVIVAPFLNKSQVLANYKFYKNQNSDSEEQVLELTSSIKASLCLST